MGGMKSMNHRTFGLVRNWGNPPFENHAWPDCSIPLYLYILISSLMIGQRCAEACHWCATECQKMMKKAA